MSAADIAALAAGIPTILGAITALVLAIKGNNKANANAAAIAAHVTSITAHPIAPPTSTIPPDKLNLSLPDRYVKPLLSCPHSTRIGAMHR
jgi:hypothetical protein